MMRAIPTVLATLVLCGCAAPAPAPTPATSAPPPRAPAPSFPQDWCGTWEGTMTISAAGREAVQRVPVTLEIAPTGEDGVYRWRTTYNHDPAKGQKDYLLRTVDIAAGRYAIDEGGGLVLDADWMGRALVSVFEVQGRTFEARYSLEGETLVQDIVFWPTIAPCAEEANPTRPPVASARLEGRQRSEFKRAAAPAHAPGQ